MLQQLHIVAALGRVFTLKEDVGVSVDHAGQNGRAGIEINHLSSGRCRTTFSNTLNLVPANNDGHVVSDLRRGSIDQVRRADGDQLIRFGVWSLCGSRDGANDGNKSKR